MQTNQLKRILSGIQPTGQMHLGNYLGAIANWVVLQAKYDCFYAIVDLHSLTTIYEDASQLKKDKFNLALDLLATGINPDQCTLFFQSDVKEHSELHLILSMITPLGWLTRVPTYKSKLKEITGKDLHTYGFLGYPVLQAADIMLYKANLVPVGEDQLPHLELTREIIRRFHSLYKAFVFPEPQAEITKFPVIPGTDGRKMSKSYNNTIPLTNPPEETRKLLMQMMTDPARKFRQDPGNPNVCPVFQFHKNLNTSEKQQEIATACQSAQIGCVDCKKACAEIILNLLTPIYEKRKDLEQHPDYVKDILKTGAQKAAKVAEETLIQVKSAVGLD